MSESLGFSVDKEKELFPKNPFLIRRRLRAVHPSSNALLFYAINDVCLKNQCGYDIYLLEYIAEKLNMDIRRI